MTEPARTFTLTEDSPARSFLAGTGSNLRSDKVHGVIAKEGSVLVPRCGLGRNIVLSNKFPAEIDCVACIKLIEAELEAATVSASMAVAVPALPAGEDPAPLRARIAELEEANARLIARAEEKLDAMREEMGSRFSELMGNAQAHISSLQQALRQVQDDAQWWQALAGGAVLKLTSATPEGAVVVFTALEAAGLRGGVVHVAAQASSQSGELRLVAHVAVPVPVSSSVSSGRGASSPG
jgi:hypothetical protein